MCVCVCVCVCEGKRQEERGKKGVKVCFCMYSCNFQKLRESVVIDQVNTPLLLPCCSAAVFAVLPYLFELDRG